MLPRGVSAQVGGVNPIERTHSGRPVSYSNRSMYNEEPVVLEVIVTWSSCKVCSRLSSARITSSLSGTVVDIVLLSSSTLTLPPIEPPVKVQDVPGRVQRSDRGFDDDNEDKKTYQRTGCSHTSRRRSRGALQSTLQCLHALSMARPFQQSVRWRTELATGLVHP